MEEGSDGVPEAASDVQGEFLFDSYEPEDVVSETMLYSPDGHAAILPDASLALGLRCVLFDHIEAMRIEAELKNELGIMDPRSVEVQEEIQALE